ncbi:MAG: hypothetical protein J5J06_20330 [Phycisphaerae bacterium]|nr:hypothetical protein [Phycisphaerae bacterium]
MSPARIPRPSGTMLLITVAIAATTARAEDVTSRFTLLRFVPGDCWMAMNYRDNPEAAWIESRWMGVLEDAKKTGIDRDALALIVHMVDEGSREQVRETMGQFQKLLSDIPWHELIGQEVAVAERLVDRLPGYEYIILARSNDGAAKRSFPALLAVMKEVEGLTKHVRLADLTIAGMEGVRAEFLDDPESSQRPELTISLFRRGDVIGLVIGEKATNDVLAMMSSKPGAPKSVMEVDRFRSAVAEAQRPEDGLMIFDIRGLLSQIRVLFGKISEETSKAEAQQWVGVVNALINELSLIDSVVTTVETKNLRQVTHTLVRLNEDRRKGPLARAIFDRQPIDNFERYVPADATSFWVSNGADFGALYDWALGFVGERIPEGKAHVAKMKGLFEQFGFDPQRDVFSWVGGEMATVRVPNISSRSPVEADAVFFLGVKDADLARAKVNQALDALAAFVQQKGQPLTIGPAKGVDAEGFRQINHPFLMGATQPVVGVADRWLIVASSAAAVNKSLAVAAGRAPSIRSSTRYREEGLSVTGPVHSMYFKDLRNYGENMAEKMQTIANIGAMFPMMLPMMSKDPKDAADLAKFANGMQEGFAIVAKLGPIFRKIDFMSSEASVSIVDGDVIRETRVLTYRAPNGVDVVRSQQ